MFISNLFEISISLELLLSQHLCITSQLSWDFFLLLCHFVHCFLASIFATGLFWLFSPLSLPCLATGLLAPDSCLDLLLHMFSSSLSLISQFLSYLLNRLWSLNLWSATSHWRGRFLSALFQKNKLLIPLLHALLSSFSGTLFCFWQSCLSLLHWDGGQSLWTLWFGCHSFFLDGLLLKFSWLHFALKLLFYFPLQVIKFIVRIKNFTVIFHKLSNYET